MNRLPIEKQEQILSLLVEGCSIRSIERITGVHRDTCVRLLGRVGTNCQRLLDEKLTNLKVEVLECDELWGYVGKKQKNLQPGENQRELGDQYIFIALDAKSKLVCSHLVGKRSTENTIQFMRDLQFRIEGRPTITTDGFTPYIQAVERSFGANVDFAQLVKVYSGDEKIRERYSPSDFVRSFPTTITGDPKRISTSFVERANLTARMQVRRLTRLTNGFSKRLASLKAAMSLHFAHYNFMRVHQSLRCTPAMECGLTDHIWSWNELLGAN